MFMRASDLTAVAVEFEMVDVVAGGLCHTSRSTVWVKPETAGLLNDGDKSTLALFVFNIHQERRMFVLSHTLLIRFT
jgi:hypothetical protein